MTMGEARDDSTHDLLYSSLMVPVLFVPVLEKLEEKDKAAAQTLKSTLLKAEYNNPGFTNDFLRGLLRKAELHNNITMCESLLRLEAHNDSEELQIARPEQVYQDLNSRAVILKKILSRIPDQINDRRQFLETIKDIANAIKYLLDAVNNVINHLTDHQHKQKLEHRKREFVRYSKKFSDTLKEFFKRNQNADVFISANYLVNHTNLILKEARDAS